MRRVARRWAVAAAVVVGCAGSAAAESEATAPPKPEAAPLAARFADPVLFPVERLGGALLGKRVTEIRAFSAVGGSLAPIAVQIDERTPDGQLVLTQGKGKGQIKDKDGDWVLAPNLGVVTAEDEVILRAVDAGPRVPSDAWPLGAAEVAEVKIADPATGREGFVYLAGYEIAAPPQPEADFVRYEVTHDRARDFDVEHVWSPRYHVAFSNPEAPFAYSDLQISPTDDGRGYGPDLLDEFRFLISINPFWINFTFRTENIAPERFGQIDGPIRVVRRIHLKVKFLGITIPEFLVKALTDIELDTDSFYYPEYFYFSGNLAVPGFIIERGDDAYGVFVTDFSDRMKGARWWNNLNPDGGAVVDGHMSEGERNLNKGFADYLAVSGPDGGWMNVLTFGEGFRKVHTELYYADNALDTPTDEEEDAPEFKRAYGATGYRLSDFTTIDPKKPMGFQTFIFALPPNLPTGGEAAYLRVLQSPLTATAGERRRPAPSAVGEAPGVGY